MFISSYDERTETTKQNTQVFQNDSNVTKKQNWMQYAECFKTYFLLNLCKYSSSFKNNSSYKAVSLEIIKKEGK